MYQCRVDSEAQSFKVFNTIIYSLAMLSILALTATADILRLMG